MNAGAKKSLAGQGRALSGCLRGFLERAQQHGAQDCSGGNRRQIQTQMGDGIGNGQHEVQPVCKASATPAASSARVHEAAPSAKAMPVPSKTGAMDAGSVRSRTTSTHEAAEDFIAPILALRPVRKSTSRGQAAAGAPDAARSFFQAPIHGPQNASIARFDGLCCYQSKSEMAARAQRLRGIRHAACRRFKTGHNPAAVFF